MNRSCFARAPRWLAFASLLVVLLALSACSAKIDLTLLADQAWEMTISTTVPTEMLDQIGGTEAIKQEMEQSAEEAQAEGVTVTWREEKPSDDVRTYVMEARGKGYDSIVSDQFTIEEIDYEGTDAIRVEFGSYMMDSTELAASEVTITGGKVLDTDGKTRGAGTAYWTDATSGGYAIVTPKGGGGTVPWWVWLIIALALVAVAGVAAWMVLGRRGGAGQPAVATAGGRVAPPAAAAETIFCPHCGAPGQTSGRFCSQCGQKIP